MRKAAVGAVVLLVGLAAPVMSGGAQAAVPEIVSFQARLSDSNGKAVADGDYSVTFRIYDSEAAVVGAEIWADTVSVTTNDGLFSLLLGHDTQALGLTFDTQYWLGIEVETDGEMTPRFRLAAAPYAIKAKDAETLDGMPVGTGADSILALDPSGMLPAVDGSQLTGVDAATVGGEDLAGLDSRYVNVTGDTMLGALGLPADGLAAGTDQLVLSGGRVGIGTASPSATLDVAGALRVDTSVDPPNIVGGYSGNSVTAGAKGATVAGGGTPDWLGFERPNTVTDNYCTVGGGISNQAGDDGGAVDGNEFATVGGGGFNLARARWSTVAGGRGNAAQNQYATVGGGRANGITGMSSTIAGGDANAVRGSFSAIGGGDSNIVDGWYATIPGGGSCEAPGNYSFAAGSLAKANHDGAFVWSDSSAFDFPSTADNEFSVRATGGVRFVTGVDGSGDPTAGVGVAAGGASWTSISGREAKKDFAPVDDDEVLEKIARLPVAYWRYRWEDEKSAPLIGPVAQDLIGEFYPGADDTRISTQQADGVHFAAIKALEARTRELREKNAEFKQQIAELRATVEALAAASE